MISEQSNLIQARIVNNLGKMIEDVDVGEIVEKFSGGGEQSGDLSGLGALSGLLGGKSGGIESLLGMLTKLGGTSTSTTSTKSRDIDEGVK